MAKNYYDILQIPKNSTQTDIKKAYRKLALLYHPDKPNGSEDKFKEISEAYDTLSNPDKKKMYDNPQHSFSFPSGDPFHFSQQHAHDIFKAFFGNNHNNLFSADFTMPRSGSNFVSVSTTTVRYPDGRVETKTTTNQQPQQFRRIHKF